MGVYVCPWPRHTHTCFTRARVRNFLGDDVCQHIMLLANELERKFVYLPTHTRLLHIVQTYWKRVYIREQIPYITGNTAITGKGKRTRTFSFHRKCTCCEEWWCMPPRCTKIVGDWLVCLADNATSVPKGLFDWMSQSHA